MRDFIHTVTQKKRVPYCFALWNTAFKKYHLFLLDENQNKAIFSKMFLYLLSTLDRKEDFLQWKEHVHLHPIDVSYDDLKEIHNDGDINPAL